MKPLNCISILLFCLACSSCAHIQSPSSNAAGFSAYPADDFALLDQEGKFHELYYYSNQKAVVLISQGNGCPIIRQSIPYVQELKERYGPRGVVFLMLNANLQDDRASIVQEAKEFNITIPILQDAAQTVTGSLGITRTAEAVVIDPRNWSVVYQGPIDDRLGYETQKSKASRPFLRDALDALLSGKKISSATNAIKGCLISFDSAVKVHTYTYTRDVAPVLIKSCLPCHSPGGVAPWSMDDYAKVKGWGRMIREVVRSKRMPPWQADPHYGKFSNDISLTPQEMRTLVRWADEGFARGDGEDLLVTAPRPQFGGWSLGQPDQIFSLNEEQSIPPTGIIAYRLVEANVTVDRDMWVRAMDLRPGNRKAVHHCDVAVEFPGDAASADAPVRKEWSKRSGLSIDGVGQIIAGYAPGYASLFVLPEDTGMFIPKGARLVFLMHYITTGKVEKDMTQLALYFYKDKPSHVYSVVQLSNKVFKIPAGDKDYRLSASHVFDKEVVLTSLTPHMHYRGRTMAITAEYPDGNSEVLLSVPDFKFNWQRRYILAEPKKLPAGTRVTAQGSYDNSKQNADNPDPTKDVTFGPLSDDEMFSAFLSYTTQGD